MAGQILDLNIDKTSRLPGDRLPPNRGLPVLPHVITFQGVLSSAAKVYRPSDEAMRDSYSNARYMRNDTGVMECVEQRQRSTALLDWHLECDDENDPEQKEVADLITKLLRRIPNFLKYRECLLQALWYGKYAVENRYQWRDIDGTMRVCVTKWKPVHGDKLVFKFDDLTGEYDPDVVGIRVGLGLTGQTTAGAPWYSSHSDRLEQTDWGMAVFLNDAERECLAIHKHLIEDGEYEDPLSAGRIHGVGIRNRIYWTWYQKQEALAWLMEYLERSGFGIELWYYPRGNAEAKDQARTAAEERIGQGRNIVLVPRPMGEDAMAYGVERIEPGMAGADTLKTILTEYFGHQIKRYILGQTLTTEASNTGLGSNLGSIQLDTYLQIIRYDATNLGETLTDNPVKTLVQYNFPGYTKPIPKFVIETEVPDVEQKLKAWQIAFDMGAKLREKDVMDLIGAAMPQPGEAVLGQSPAGPLPGMPGQNGDGSGTSAMEDFANLRAMIGRNGAGQNEAPAPPPPATTDSSPFDAPGRSTRRPTQYEADKLRGGLADGRPDKDFDPAALAKGTAHEREHTDDEDEAREIAKDHLAEDPDYYEKLDKLEATKYSQFDESKHPRDNGGQFSTKDATMPPKKSRRELERERQAEHDAYIKRYTHHFGGPEKEKLSLVADAIAKHPDWEVINSHFGSVYFRHTPSGKTLRVSDHEPGAIHRQAASFDILPFLDRDVVKAFPNLVNTRTGVDDAVGWLKRITGTELEIKPDQTP